VDPMDFGDPVDCLDPADPEDLGDCEVLTHILIVHPMMAANVKKDFIDNGLVEARSNFKIAAFD